MRLNQTLGDEHVQIVVDARVVHRSENGEDQPQMVTAKDVDVLEQILQVGFAREHLGFVSIAEAFEQLEYLQALKVTILEDDRHADECADDLLVKVRRVGDVVADREETLDEHHRQLKADL